MEKPMTTDIGARVRAKFPLDTAVAELWAGKLPCDWCKRECPIVVGVRLPVGRCETFLNLAEIGAFELEREVCAVLGPIARAHSIGWRESRSRGCQVLANGCPHCGEMLGERHDPGPWACREKIGDFGVELGLMWRRAMFAPGDRRERVKAEFPEGVAGGVSSRRGFGGRGVG
jgi:hypothetical protein